MSTDVVPVLNEKISKSFRNHVMKDRQIASVSKRIRDGTAKFEDAHKYAERLGEDLSKALSDAFTEDALPNGKLYYNIAKRTIVPALENNYELVNETTSEIQKLLDKKKKLGLGSVKAEFPSERIQGLIDKITADDISLEDALIWIKEPIVNNSEAFVDDFVEANSKFQADAGLEVKLVRKAEAKCCDWCASLEGVYDYGDAPSDIYRRHEFCRCTVTFQSKRTSQNVWSKRKWETSKEDIEARRQAGQTEKMSTQDRLSQLEQLQRDEEIKRYMRETGYTRRTAQEATRNKSPAEIDAEIEKIKERQARITRR